MESGGLAGFRKNFEIALKDLTPFARRVLRQAIAAPRPPGPGPARDLKNYRLTLADARGRRDLIFDEAHVPAGAGPLVRYLSRRAAPDFV